MHSCCSPCTSRKGLADVHPAEFMESETLRASSVTVPIFSTTTVKGMVSPASGWSFPFSSSQDPLIAEREIREGGVRKTNLQLGSSNVGYANNRATVCGSVDIPPLRMPSDGSSPSKRYSNAKKNVLTVMMRLA